MYIFTQDKNDKKISALFTKYRTPCFKYGIDKQKCLEYLEELKLLLSDLLEDVPEGIKINESVSFKL